MFILVLLSGDVEPNPGPDSVVDSINSSHNGSLEMLTNYLSILHLKIQSLLPKLDLIAAESEAYDLLIFSESWLKAEIKSNNIGLTNFHSPFRRDRCDRPGGRVVIYVRDNIYCKRRGDLELQGLEAVWIELSIKSKKLLIEGCDRPPNNNAAYFDLLSESIDRANTNIIDIFILNDVNDDDEFRFNDASTHEGHLRQNGELTWFCSETIIMISHKCIKCKTRTNLKIKAVILC